MKMLAGIVSFCVIIAFFSYTPVQQSQEVSLVGSWELISFINHGDGNTEWESYGSNILYQKHISPTHFTWLHYDKDRDLLMGMGGGTYIIDDEGRYIENIDFFHPPGSSELGQSIPFDVGFKDGIWYHTGYAKRMEINGLGLLISTDSVKIEEKWSPITGKFNNNKNLVGTWTLEKYRFKSETPYLEYPDFMGYLKVLTPTHFTWVQYNKEGDEVYAAGSGFYEYDGSKYIETLQMTHPANSNVKSAVIPFDIELTINKWKHFGYVPRPDGKQIDDNMIDEYWVRYDSDIEDETAFMNE